MLDRVRIMALDFDTLKRVRAIHPQVTTLAQMTAGDFARMDIGQPAAIVDQVVPFANGIAVDKSFLTPGLVAQAHLRKLTVAVGTVDTEDEMRKFIAMGVDSITTNRPDIFKKIMGR